MGCDPGAWITHVPEHSIAKLFLSIRSIKVLGLNCYSLMVIQTALALEPGESSRDWKTVFETRKEAAFSYSTEWENALKKSFEKKYSTIFLADVAITNDESKGYDFSKLIQQTARKSKNLVMVANSEVLLAAAALGPRGVITVIDNNPAHMDALKFLFNETQVYADYQSWKDGVLKLARGNNQSMDQPISHRSHLQEILDELTDTDFKNLRQVVREGRVYWILSDWKSSALIDKLRADKVPTRYDLIYVSNIPLYVSKKTKGHYSTPSHRRNNKKHFIKNIRLLSGPRSEILGGVCRKAIKRLSSLEPVSKMFK